MKKIPLTIPVLFVLVPIVYVVLINSEISPLQEGPTAVKLDHADIYIQNDGRKILIKDQDSNFIFDTKATPVAKTLTYEHGWENPDRCEISNIEVAADGDTSLKLYFAYGGPTPSGPTVLSVKEDTMLKELGYEADNRNYAGGGWGDRPLFRSWATTGSGQMQKNVVVDATNFLRMPFLCQRVNMKVLYSLSPEVVQRHRFVNRFIARWNGFVDALRTPFLLLYYLSAL